MITKQRILNVLAGVGWIELPFLFIMMGVQQSVAISGILLYSFWMAGVCFRDVKRNVW